jgi:hypothetical protein
MYDVSRFLGSESQRNPGIGVAEFSSFAAAPMTGVL